MYGHLYFLKSSSKLLSTTHFGSTWLLSVWTTSSFLLRAITWILSNIIWKVVILRLCRIWANWCSLLFGIYLTWWSLTSHSSSRITLALTDISEIRVVLSVLLPISWICSLSTWRPTNIGSLAIDLLLLHLLLLVKLLLKLVGASLILENSLIQILSSICWIPLSILIVIHN